MKLFNTFKKKIKTHGLITSLALISITGFAINTYNVYFNASLPVLLSYPSIILGAGLILESQIIDFIKYKNRFIQSENEMAKFVTFIIGVMIMIGGIATSPVLGLKLSAQMVGAIGTSNFIALFVILYELFFVD